MSKYSLEVLQALDGDTFRSDENPKRFTDTADIRIQGMDTFETAKPDKVSGNPLSKYSQEVIEALSADGGSVNVNYGAGFDKWGRRLGTLNDGSGNDVSLDMIQAGLANPTDFDGAESTPEDQYQAQLTGVARAALGLNRTSNPLMRDSSRRADEWRKSNEWRPFTDNPNFSLNLLPYDNRGTFSKSWDRGVGETKMAIGGALNWFGDLVGSDDLVKKGKEITRRAQATVVNSEREVKDYTQIKDAGDFVDYLVETAGEMAPSLIFDAAVTLATAGTGVAAVGARRMAGAVITDAVKKKIIKNSALGGAALSGFAQSAGNMENQLEAEGSEVNTFAAGASGLIGAAANTVPIGVAFGKLAKTMGIDDKAAEVVKDRIEKITAKDRIKDVVDTGLTVGRAEGVTSAAQMLADELIKSSALDKELDINGIQFIDDTIRAVLGGTAAASAASTAANVGMAYSQARADAEKEFGDGWDKESVETVEDIPVSNDIIDSIDSAINNFDDLNKKSDPKRKKKPHESVPNLDSKRYKEVKAILEPNDGKPLAEQEVAQRVEAGDLTWDEVAQFTADDFNGDKQAPIYRTDKAKKRKILSELYIRTMDAIRDGKIDVDQKTKDKLVEVGELGNEYEIYDAIKEVSPVLASIADKNSSNYRAKSMWRRYVENKTKAPEDKADNGEPEAKPEAKTEVKPEVKPIDPESIAKELAEINAKRKEAKAKLDTFKKGLEVFRDRGESNEKIAAAEKKVAEVEKEVTKLDAEARIRNSQLTALAKKESRAESPKNKDKDIPETNPKLTLETQRRKTARSFLGRVLDKIKKSGDKYGWKLDLRRRLDDYDSIREIGFNVDKSTGQSYARSFAKRYGVSIFTRGNKPILKVMPDGTKKPTNIKDDQQLIDEVEQKILDTTLTQLKSDGVVDPSIRLDESDDERMQEIMDDVSSSINAGRDTPIEAYAEMTRRDDDGVEEKTGSIHGVDGIPVNIREVAVNYARRVRSVRALAKAIHDAVTNAGGFERNRKLSKVLAKVVSHFEKKNDTEKLIPNSMYRKVDIGKVPSTVKLFMVVNDKDIVDDSVASARGMGQRERRKEKITKRDLDKWIEMANNNDFDGVIRDFRARGWVDENVAISDNPKMTTKDRLTLLENSTILDPELAKKLTKEQIEEAKASRIKVVNDEGRTVYMNLPKLVKLGMKEAETAQKDKYDSNGRLIENEYTDGTPRGKIVEGFFNAIGMLVENSYKVDLDQFADNARGSDPVIYYGKWSNGETSKKMRRFTLKQGYGYIKGAQAGRDEDYAKTKSFLNRRGKNTGALHDVLEAEAQLQGEVDKLARSDYEVGHAPAERLLSMSLEERARERENSTQSQGRYDAYRMEHDDKLKEKTKQGDKKVRDIVSRSSAKESIKREVIGGVPAKNKVLGDTDGGVADQYTPVSNVPKKAKIIKRTTPEAKESLRKRRILRKQARKARKRASSDMAARAAKVMTNRIKELSAVDYLFADSTPRASALDASFTFLSFEEFPNRAFTKSPQGKMSPLDKESTKKRMGDGYSQKVAPEPKKAGEQKVADFANEQERVDNMAKDLLRINEEIASARKKKDRAKIKELRQKKKEIEQRLGDEDLVYEGILVAHDPYAPTDPNATGDVRGKRGFNPDKVKQKTRDAKASGYHRRKAVRVRTERKYKQVAIRRRKEVKKGIFRFFEMIHTRLERIHPELNKSLREQLEYSRVYAGDLIGEMNKIFTNAKDMQQGYDDVINGVNSPAAERYKKAINLINKMVKEHDPDFRADKDVAFHLDPMKIDKDRAGFIAILREAGIENPEAEVEAILNGDGSPALSGFVGESNSTRSYSDKYRKAAKALRDGGFLDNDAPRHLIRYAHSAGKWAAWNKAFRKNDDPNGLYKQFAAEVHPANRDEFERLMRSVTGKNVMDAPPWVRRFNSIVMAFQAATVLLFSGIASIPELAAVYSRARGLNGVLEQDFKNIMYGKTYRDTKQIAAEFNIISNEAMEHALQTLYSFDGLTVGRFAQWVSSTMFKYNGQNLVTEMSRIVATSAGRRFLEAHAKSGSDTSKRMLAEVGIDAKTVLKFLEHGDINTKEGKAYKYALHRFVNQSVVNPTRGQVPMIANDPRFLILTSLKKFFYGFYDNVHKGLYRHYRASQKEGTGKDVIITMAMTGLLMLSLSAVSEFLRELIKYPLGRPAGRQRTTTDWVTAVIGATGALGPLQAAESAFEMGQYGRNPITSFLGPTTSLADDLYSGRLQPSRFVPVASQIPWLGYPINQGYKKLMD